MADWLEAEMMAWRGREQKLEKLFGAAVLKSREFLIEKLAHFEVLELRLKGSTNLDQRLAMRIIRQQRRELERKVYPGFIVRGLYRLAKIALDRNRANKYRKYNSAKFHQLGEMLTAKGFSDAAEKVQRNINQGQSEFSIEATHYKNERERVDFTLEFKPDQAGHVGLSDCRARLQREDGSRTAYISLAKNSLEEITAHQAYNLLSGRAVAVGANWLQLDFNDKDASGNYKTKVFPPSFGFDCETMLSSMKLKHPNRRPELIAALKDGDQVEVEQQGMTGKLKIAANAQNKTLLPEPEGKSIGAKAISGKVIPLNKERQQQKQVRRQR